MKHFGRLLSVITWLLIIGGLVIISGGLMGRPLLMAAVPTTSMVPALQPGDLIVVFPTWAIAPPGLGDIVVYKTPQDRNWIVHRIVDGNATEGFVTRGDANSVPDPRRVFPRDMAGVVPQWDGKALRVQRLGLLRSNSGPLSSPILAGVALVIGVFLLVMDMQPIRVPRLRRRAQHRHGHEMLMPLYLGLVATAFLTTLIPAWTLSSSEHVQYEIVDRLPANIRPLGRYLASEGFHETVTIQNPSPLPLLIAFSSTDPTLSYTPWDAIIGPKSDAIFAVQVDNPTVGKYEGQLRMGVYLPLLPRWVLVPLARKSLALAAVATALVPAAVIVGLACLDPRVRAAVARAGVKIRLRLSAI